MKKRLAFILALSVFVVVLATVGLIWLLLAGKEEAFWALLGVGVGGAATALPQAYARRTDRLRRTRAASVLVRSELYAYQNWIAQSLKDSKWAPVPTDVAEAEHLADLAYALDTWAKWQPIGQARRYTNQLIGLAEGSRPNRESRRHAWRTFKAINRAIVVLATVDDGPSEPHEATEDVRIAVVLAAAKRRRISSFGL